MKMLTKFAMLAVFFGGLAPFAAQAAPSIMLEKSASYALSDSVFAYRVPTQDSAGVIRYFDVIIDLGVASNGTILTTANVSSFPSPSVTTGVIAPGTYRETGGPDICTVTNMTLTNGRIQSFFICTSGGTGTTPGTGRFEFSVATGPVTSGHPFLAELLSFGVNLRTDVTTQTWGLVTQGGFSLGTCATFSAGNRIGAKTNGSQIVLSVMGNGSSTLAPRTLCGNTLTKI